MTPIMRMIDAALKYTELRSGVFSVSVIPGTTMRLLAYLQETLEQDLETFKTEMEKLWEMKQILEERYEQVQDEATRKAAAALRRAFKKGRDHYRSWSRKKKAAASDAAGRRAGEFNKQFGVAVSAKAFQRGEKAGIKGLLPYLIRK